MLDLRSPLDGIRSPFGVARGWTPASLFGAGAWYDVSDETTVFTDIAGTILASVGDAVARINDKSGNNIHATQAITAARPILRQDVNGNRYLEFDGVDDQLQASANITLQAKAALWVAVAKEASGDDLERIYDSAVGVLAIRYNSGGGLDCALGNFTTGSGRVVASFGNDTSPHVFAYQRDQAGDVATIRADGAIIATDTHDQGAYSYSLQISDRTRMRWYGGVILADQYLDNATALKLDSYLARQSGATI
jgi:hypothetical protein